MVGMTAGFGLLVAYLSYQAVRSVWSILVLVIVSGFLAVGLNPAVVRLQRIGLRRGLAVTVVALTGLLFACGGLFAVIPPVVNEGIQFAEAMPGYIEDLGRTRWVEEINSQYNVVGRIQEAFTPDNLTTAVGGVLSGATIVFGQIFNVLTIAILTLYFLAAFDRLKEGAYRLVPASRRERARLLGDEILAKVGGYMVGSLLIATLAGLTSLTFMLITGIPYPLALALVVAICDLIPQVGAYLGALLLTLVGFTVSIPVAIAALVFFTVYQQLENWLIYPRIMSRTTQVSDLAAIVAVLVGAALLGVVGVLIAIPATAAIQLIVREVILPRQNSR
ncbi:MAG TPA: AI-2E family transporter [Micromonosporaceae bacterium]